MTYVFSIIRFLLSRNHMKIFMLFDEVCADSLDKDVRLIPFQVSFLDQQTPKTLTSEKKPEAQKPAIWAEPEKNNQAENG